MNKLVYIAGIGHNGSTLLDLLLGASEGVESSSQLNDLLAPYQPKTESTADRFWREVLAKLPDGGQSLSQQNNSVVLEKRFLRMLLNPSVSKQYAHVNWEFLDVVFEESRAEIVVDSSKNISRALGLLRGHEDQVFILHLVRDLRSFVNSSNMRKREHGKRVGYFKPALHWYAKNLCASIFLRRRSKHYLRINYEDFIANPEACIERISEWINHPLNETIHAVSQQSPIFPSKTLGFRGNRILKEEEVVFDPKRSKRDGAFHSAVFWYTLGWFSSFWGYRK